jgi:hypothetical protein
MHNDLFDWSKDETRQTCTYFLSEAQRRRNAAEPLVSWVAREGFTWAIDKLQAWMAELKLLAVELNSPALLAYLATRETMLLKQQDEITKGLHHLAKIAALGTKRP